VALKDTNTTSTAVGDSERKHNATKEMKIPSLPHVDVNTDKTVDCTSGEVVHGALLSSSCTNTTSCDSAMSVSDNSINFQQCTMSMSFASIPVSVPAPFTFTAAPHSHQSPVHGPNLFSLPAGTVSTSAHKPTVTTDFISSLAVPQTDTKISFTTMESDAFSVLYSSGNVTSQAGSTYSATAVIQTTGCGSVSLPVAASVAKVSLVPSSCSNDPEISTVVLAPIATFSAGSTIQTSCVVSTLAKTSATVNTTANKNISNKKAKAASSPSSAVATVKSGKLS